VKLSYVKCLCFLGLILAISAKAAIADNTVPAENSPKAAKPAIRLAGKSPSRRCTSGSYCGIYCLYAVMKLSNIDVDPNELLKPEYIGSHKGSSLAELKKAAEDNRLYAAPVGKLTTRWLCQSPYPVILHVKSTADRKEYDHYELFLETKDGQARLYGPPAPVRLVPFYKLAPRWDGTGLIVSDTPIDLGAVFAPARKRFIIYAVIAIAVILSIRWVRRHWLPSLNMMSRRRSFGLSIAQVAGLATAVLLWAITYHFANDEGFLAHPDATAAIQQAHLDSFLPKLTERQVRKLLNTDTVFIDARIPTDFEAGHLKGAINVPANTCQDEHQKAMADVAKDARIVIYCQSAGCPFAKKVAIKLITDGYSNVSLFKDDWQKWAAKNNK